MSTGAAFTSLTAKRILGKEDLDDNFLSYLKTITAAHFQRIYDKDGAYTAKLGLSASGIDKFQVTGSSDGTDGKGHVLNVAALAAAYRTNLNFENTVATTYYVGARYTEVPSGIQINPRSGMPEFIKWVETIGEKAAPDLVTNNGGVNLTFRVNSVTEAGVTNAGRKVMVYLKAPAKLATTEGVAVEICTVAFTAGHNVITTTAMLGQVGTVSTTAADYDTVLLGPTCKRNTDLSADANYFFLGTIVGGGAGNVLTSASTADQFLFSSTLANISDVTRIDSHGFMKIEVKADASDVDEAQIQVRASGGAEVFAIDEDGDIRIYGGYQGNVIPVTDNTYTLGDITHRFSTVYMMNLSLAGDFLPASDATQDLGSAALRWAEGHFSSFVYAGWGTPGIGQGSGLRLRVFHSSSLGTTEESSSIYSLFDTAYSGSAVKKGIDSSTRLTAASGTASEAHGARVLVAKTGAGIVTTLSGVTIEHTNDGAAAATALYGLWIKATPGSGATVKHSIHIDEPADSDDGWAIWGAGDGDEKSRLGVLFIAGACSPEVDGLSDLGDSGHIWRETWSQRLHLHDDNVYLRFQDLDASLNQKVWSWDFTDGAMTLNARDDAEATPTVIMQFDRSALSTDGISFNGDVFPWTTNSHDIGSSGARWLDVYGRSFFSQSTGTTDVHTLRKTDDGADQKAWLWRLLTGTLRLAIQSDDGSVTTTMMEFTRTAMTPGNITLTGHLRTGTDDTYEIGSTTNQWRNIYAQRLLSITGGDGSTYLPTLLMSNTNNGSNLKRWVTTVEDTSGTWKLKAQTDDGITNVDALTYTRTTGTPTLLTVSGALTVGGTVTMQGAASVAGDFTWSNGHYTQESRNGVATLTLGAGWTAVPFGTASEGARGITKATAARFQVARAGLYLVQYRANLVGSSISAPLTAFAKCVLNPAGAATDIAMSLAATYVVATANGQGVHHSFFVALAANDVVELQVFAANNYQVTGSSDTAYPCMFSLMEMPTSSGT